MNSLSPMLPRMLLRFPIFCGALCLCLIARAEEAPITKIVLQMIAPSAVGDAIPGKKKTIYRAGEKFARIEEEPDAAGQTLLITNEPDSWVINLEDKTGRHLVDEGPKFVTQVPIFWTSSGQPERDFEELEFGAELRFFGAGRALETKPRKVEGRTYKTLSIKTGEHQAILLLHPKTGMPFQIDLRKFGRLVSTVRYLSYETQLPFDPKLFQEPGGIQFSEPN